MDVDARTIDPAFAAIGAYAKVACGTVRDLQHMRQATIFADGALSKRHKALAALLWSIAARCEPCVAYYAQLVKASGATEAELGEMLAVAATMGGCVGETWALKAYRAWRDGATTAQAPPAECCP